MSGRIPRVRTDIDGHSFLEIYPDGQSSALIIFVHGIFGDPQGTWAETPQTLMMFPALADADWGSFGYDTGLIYRRDAMQTVDQLLLWIRTHAARYRNIFFVAHSMGGLFVRDVCAKLALSQSQNDLALFANIKHGFLVASPVGGAVWARRISWIPLIRSLNSHIAYLEQGESYISKFPTYAAAIDAAKKHGGSRPKFSIFIGTRDQVVQNILTSVLTEDDTYEGPVPGSHSTLKTALNANSTLVKRIVQIVSDYSRRSMVAPQEIATAIIASRASSSLEAPRSDTLTAPVSTGGGKAVILISCSAHKRTDSEVMHPKKGGVLSAVADGEIGLHAIQTRAQIMGLLQSGRIDGTEFKEGNRAGRPENRALVLGPDFGGAINEPKYLPAFWRYSGRTYQASREDWSAFLSFPDPVRPSILIMSGLYGLIPFDECIQNYDCHITDTDVQSGQTVVAYWGATMTDILLSHCDRLKSSGVKVGPIIDLLSESSYQSALDWERIYPRYPVLHRVFETKAGRDALVNIGIFLRTILRDPAKAIRLPPDRFIDEPEFIDADRIAFEYQIGQSPLAVARD
jgi:pimeloyl-ACP methyl ester carboxylesterase